MRRRLLVIVPLLGATLAINGLGAVAHAVPLPLSIFPNDTFTVADASQLTGRRVNLPMTNCSVQVSKCNEIALVDQLDGFDLDPNLKIKFSGPIDVSKVNGTNLYLERVCSCRVARMPLVRLVWDPSTNTLYGHPKHQLRESSTYHVTVTSGINGQSGTATFTTMSATVGLRQMQAQLDDGSAYTAAGIAAADRGLHFVRPDGTRTVYPATNVTMVRRFDDTGSGPLVEHMVLDSAIPGAATYAFGSYLSPSWLDADRKIPQTPTRTGAPAITGLAEVGFTLILPTGIKPAGGWPVAIFGPGITRSKYDLFLASDENLKRGIATIAIDPVGHAFGPRSEAGVDLAVPPTTVRFSGFGRGVDLNHDGTITDQEGVSTLGQPSRYASVALRSAAASTSTVTAPTICGRPTSTTTRRAWAGSTGRWSWASTPSCRSVRSTSPAARSSRSPASHRRFARCSRPSWRTASRRCSTVGRARTASPSRCRSTSTRPSRIPTRAPSPSSWRAPAPTGSTDPGARRRSHRSSASARPPAIR